MVDSPHASVPSDEVRAADLPAVPPADNPEASNGVVTDGEVAAVELPQGGAQGASGADGRVESDVTPVVEEFDRTRSQYSMVTKKTYPAPSAFDNVNVAEDLDLLAEAPWLELEALADNELMKRYSEEGWLPGSVPLSALNTPAWRDRCCHAKGALFVTSSRTDFAVRREFARAVYSGYNRLRTFVPVDPLLRLDMHLYRTQGEIEYARALGALGPDILGPWRGRLMVAQRALMFTKPQLRCEFRYLRKNAPYWRSFVRSERRARSVMGNLVPYQDITAFQFRADARADRWPVVNTLWSRVEVPQGCLVELPPVVSYLGSELVADPESGVWVVVLTEMVAKTASFILQEAYDCYRLWALSPHTIRFIRELDLSLVLGNQVNVDELLGFVQVIEDTDFKSLPGRWKNRSSRSVEKSPGRIGVGADWVYYDPHERRCIDEATAKAKLAGVRASIPTGHPVGYEFDALAGGWEDPVTAGGDDEVMHDEVSEGEDCGWEGDGVASGAASGAEPSFSQGGGVVHSDTDVVRQFLREVGMPEHALVGGWDELRGFVRGRLG